MEEKRRSSLFVFVGATLLVVGVAYLSPGSWAAASLNSEPVTVPAPAEKSVDEWLMLPTHDAEFGLLIEVPQQSLIWHNVTLTDTVDSYLSITGVDTSQGSFTVLGQAVTVCLGSIDAGEMATVGIDVTVNADAPHGQLIPNVAYVNADNFPHPEASNVITITVGIPRYLPLLMKRYSPP
jgi:hypothetical protein